MPSNIPFDVPAFGVPTAASVRAAYTVVKDELDLILARAEAIRAQIVGPPGGAGETSRTVIPASTPFSFTNTISNTAYNDDWLLQAPFTLDAASPVVAHATATIWGNAYIQGFMALRLDLGSDVGTVVTGVSPAQAGDTPQWRVPISTVYLWPSVPPGAHTIRVRWRVSATGSILMGGNGLNAPERNLLVRYAQPLPAGGHSLQQVQVASSRDTHSVIGGSTNGRHQ